MDLEGLNYGNEETASDNGKLAHNFSLTRAEERVVEYLVSELGFHYGKLKRNPKGVDFTYDSDLGIEVKRDPSYSLSSCQLDSINEHAITLIIVSKNKGCWVEDAIGHIHKAEDEKEYSEMIETMMD